MLYDKEIREPLFEFLESRYEKVRIIEEKTMGRSRADIVMVLEHELVGIEIKSDADSYARLKRQIKDYNQYFDRNYVVAGTCHAMHIEEHVPDWWGIVTVEEVTVENLAYADFYVLREAKRNPKLDPKRKLSMLWRPELALIQAKHGLHKYERKSKEFVIGKILEKVPEEVLGEEISEILFERDYEEGIRAIEEYRQEKRAEVKAAGSSARRRRRRNSGELRKISGKTVEAKKKFLYNELEIQCSPYLDRTERAA